MDYFCLECSELVLDHPQPLSASSTPSTSYSHLHRLAQHGLNLHLGLLFQREPVVRAQVDQLGDTELPERRRDLPRNVVVVQQQFFDSTQPADLGHDANDLRRSGQCCTM